MLYPTKRMNNYYDEFKFNNEYVEMLDDILFSKMFKFIDYVYVNFDSYKEPNEFDKYIPIYGFTKKILERKIEYFGKMNYISFINFLKEVSGNPEFTISFEREGYCNGVINDNTGTYIEWDMVKINI